MKREYKGFYIELEPSYRKDGPFNKKEYHLYHVVTGNCAGTLPTIKDAKDEIDSIHTNRKVYAGYAGCKPADLRLKRKRWVYNFKKF